MDNGAHEINPDEIKNGIGSQTLIENSHMNDNNKNSNQQLGMVDNFNNQLQNI